MNKIEIAVFHSGPNGDNYRQAMSVAANVALKGQKAKTVQQVLDLKLLDVAEPERIDRLLHLPHATLQKFAIIPVIFTGVSRRFLAQITRHQNEIKFSASSLHHSDHTNDLDFVMPIEILRADADTQRQYIDTQLIAFDSYCDLVGQVGRDAAAYALPEATRLTLFAAATIYEWKHIISQRCCNRASPEIQYTMLLLWKTLHSIDHLVFAPDVTGPACMRHNSQCAEERSCKEGFSGETPSELLLKLYPELYHESE